MVQLARLMGAELLRPVARHAAADRERDEDVVRGPPCQSAVILVEAFREFAFRPFRVLGADFVERAFVFVGLVAMKDPPRPEARVAIEECRRAGIAVVMKVGNT